MSKNVKAHNWNDAENFVDWVSKINNNWLFFTPEEKWHPLKAQISRHMIMTNQCNTMELILALLLHIRKLENNSND